jgi:pimeloyl-ACP methyl ester carboxylesterase
MMADQLEAVRNGGKGISFDFGILTRDWGFPLEKIQTPISMWHGAEDDLTPVALARYISEHIPDCAIKIVPGAGHAGTYSCVDEVINTLVQ